MFSRPVKEYANRQRVAEQIKAAKPPDWIQKMNKIRNLIEEIINADIILK